MKYNDTKNQNLSTTMNSEKSKSIPIFNSLHAMSKITKFFTLLLCLFFIFSCKSNKQIANSANEYQKLEDALLWKINVPNAKSPSYLYGTIHLIDAKEYFLPKGTLSAIDGCTKMMFELDMAEMTDMSKMMGLMDKLFMKDDVSLPDLMTAEEYKLVEKKFSEMGLPLFFLNKIKPMILAAFASGDMSPTALQDGSMKSYEMEFFEMAEDKGMTTGGLETIEVQLAIFDSIPYKDQAEMLIKTLKSSNSEDDEFKNMIAMYKAQKINSMIDMINAEDSGLALHEDILLTKRNESWIDVIIENSRKQATFFAVGAGHLAGKNGVIHLLRKRGIKVEPIK
jgi:hypothetical protein